MAGVKINLTPCLRKKNQLDSLFEEDVDGAELGGHVGDELSVIAYTAEEGSELFDVGGHWHFGEGGDLVGVRVTPCLLYTSPSPRDGLLSRMPSSA